MRKIFINVGLWLWALFVVALAGYLAIKFLPSINFDRQSELYGLLIVVTFAFTLLSRRLIALFIPGHLYISSKRRLVLNFVATLCITLPFGPRTLMRFYEYDDWVYLGYKYSGFTIDYLNETINFHYVPILKAILYLMDRFFSPDYVVNGLIFLFFLVFCVTCLLELSFRTIERPLLAFILTILFAAWPTADMSRYWFGGGFWLLVPLPFYLLLLMRVQSLTSNAKVSTQDLLVVFLLTSLTALSSSMIVVPAFGMVVYLAAYHLLDQHLALTKATVKYATLITIMLLPSVPGLYMRFNNIRRMTDFSGLVDGSFLVNIFVFVRLKLLYSNVVWVAVFVLLVFCYVRIQQKITTARRFGTRADVPAHQCALFMMAAACFGLYVLQVGVARSWESYAVVTPYYVSYPLLCCFMMGIALLGAALPASSIQVAEVVSTEGKVERWLTVILILLACHASYTAFTRNRLIIDDYQFVNAQRKHVESLGRAVCDVLSKYENKKIALIPALPFTRCKDCLALFKAPQSFLDDFSSNNEFYRTIAKRFAEPLCENASHYLVIFITGDELVTTGTNMSPLMTNYYRQYYGAP